MDLKTRKLMTMQKALHTRDVINRLCMSRKEGQRRPADIRGSVDTLMRGFEELRITLKRFK